MRDRSIDEFESIFEQASIPVLDIENLTLGRMACVLADDPLDTSTLELADYLKKRFSAEVVIHWPVSMQADQANQTAKNQNFTVADNPFHSTAELVGQVSIGKSQLVILPDPKKDTSDTDINALVEGTTPPILLIREPLDKPADIFRNILHSLTGNFKQKRNFAYSFTLVNDRGKLRLIHTIDENEIKDVQETLRLSPEIAESSGDELLENLTHHGERYLKAVVAAARDQSFEVSYRLGVGDTVDVVQKELHAGDYGLLVLGTHHEGHSHVSADDYQLMHQIQHIPVMAL